MKKLILTLIILAITIGSCKKNEDSLSHSNYLIFGHYYGECGGEDCIEIFRLEQNHLFEDIKDNYPNSVLFYSGSYVKLSQEKFDTVKDLIDYFPAELLSETGTVIGQPDAGDWGGLYIEYNYNGVRKFWLLDQMKSNVPAKYHNFIDKVNEKIRLIE